MTIKQAIDYLASKPEMVFDIYDVPGKMRTHTNLSFFQHDRIVNNPYAFFESLVNLYGEIQIQLKQIKGASTKNPEPTITLKKEVAQRKFLPIESPGLQESQSSFETSFSAMPQGLNAAVFTDMINARTLGDKVENLQRLYDTEKELRQRIDSELQQLRITHGALQTKYDTLELTKELEKDRALLEQKGSLGQLAEKINPDKLLGIAETYMKAKMGASKESEGLEGLGLPEYKTDFIEVIQEEEITEQYVDLLNRIAISMAEKPGFYQGLLKLLTPKSAQNEIQNTSESDSDNDFSDDDNDDITM